MNIFSHNPMWHLIAQSDATSKFVLLILLGMSIICWTLFFTKLILFNLKNKHFTAALKQIDKVKNNDQLNTLAQSMRGTSPGYFLTKNLTFLADIKHNALDQTITDHELLLLEKNCDNSMQTIMLHSESYLAIVSSCAAVAPLLGLFGTVWGLVHSFIRISETQVADIATIAPGIAEALITTLAGLIVAIPALIMFNCLQTKVRHLEHNLILLADKMFFVIQHQRERK